jgi:imidazolonepropionase-like amidohydrolase
MQRPAFAVLVLVIMMTIGSSVLAQDAAKPQKTTIIKAGRLIDVRAGQVITGRAILVVGERIKAVGELNEILKSAPTDATVIDLSNATVLPGLIDCHTHVLLQGDITQADYDKQLLKESIPFRAIRATVAARTALMNGFTAMRDLETEGAMYADVDVKRAINQGIIPGPRMFVSTRAFSATGMYPLLGYSWELKVPEGVQVVDGPDEIRKAVREQVKYGADWIKFYCDRRYFMEGGKLRSKVNFTEDEMRAIVGEAHRLDRRVAAHAIGKDGIMAALKAGVDTIEHGDGFDEESIDLMVKQGVYWCPTIYVTAERKAFGLAVKKGAKIAYGTDAGGYAWTENQAKEFSYMVRYGMTPMQAIQSATVVAAQLLQAEGDLGAIEPGKFADIVAVQSDPLHDIAALERVTFVMKSGQVFKGESSK